MFLLNGDAVRKYIERGEIQILDVHWGNLGPTYYRLRLGKPYSEAFVENGHHGAFEEEKATAIRPGMHYMVETLETIVLSDRIQGFVFQTTNLSLRGFELIGGVGVEPEYKGKLHFVLRSLWNEPRNLKLGIQIAKIYFFDVSESCRYAEQAALFEAWYDWYAERKKIVPGYDG